MNGYEWEERNGIGMKIGFIGLGNMAKAMIGGMLDKGMASKEEIIGSDKMPEMREAANNRWGIKTYESNAQVAEEAEVLVLAVKPQFLAQAISELKDAVSDDTLIISIAAGKKTQEIEHLFGKSIKLVRCMPNTPALVGEGCSALCGNAHVTEVEMKQCKAIMESFGMAEEVPENLMDAVTGLSGSSPAFVFMFIEAMADGAVLAGMPRKQAYTFAAQTVMGSAKLMLETGKNPGELKDMVCSPAGTTIEGVRTLEERAFRAAVMDAVKAAVEKSQKM